MGIGSLPGGVRAVERTAGKQARGALALFAACHMHCRMPPVASATAAAVPCSHQLHHQLLHSKGTCLSQSQIKGTWC